MQVRSSEQMRTKTIYLLIWFLILEREERSTWHWVRLHLVLSLWLTRALRSVLLDNYSSLLHGKGDRHESGMGCSMQKVWRPENCSEARREARLYRSFYSKGQVVWTSEGYCQWKETPYPKLRHLELFYVWEDASVWARWNHPSHRHLSPPGPASCVFASLAALGLTVGSGCSLIAGILLLPECPQGLHWRAGLPMTVTSLFTDKVGNTPFLNR